jgi:hypothetical protein
MGTAAQIHLIANDGRSHIKMRQVSFWRFGCCLHATAASMYSSASLLKSAASSLSQHSLATSWHSFAWAKRRSAIFGGSDIGPKLPKVPRDDVVLDQFLKWWLKSSLTEDTTRVHKNFPSSQKAKRNQR